MKKSFLTLSLLVSLTGSVFCAGPNVSDVSKANNGLSLDAAKNGISNFVQYLIGPRKKPAPVPPKTFMEKLKTFKVADLKSFVNGHRYESAAVTALVATGAYLLYKNCNTFSLETEEN